MARPISPVEISPEEKSELLRRVGARSGSQRDALRASIVLLRAEGYKEMAVAEKLHISPANL
jgi:hypothetical protein